MTQHCHLPYRTDDVLLGEKIAGHCIELTARHMLIGAGVAADDHVVEVGGVTLEDPHLQIDGVTLDVLLHGCHP